MSFVTVKSVSAEIELKFKLKSVPVKSTDPPEFTVEEKLLPEPKGRSEADISLSHSSMALFAFTISRNSPFTSSFICQ